MVIECPACGQSDKGWLAIELHQSPRQVEFDLDEDSLVLEFGFKGEFVHDSETSVITGYKCGDEHCVFSLTPLDITAFVKSFTRRPLLEPKGEVESESDYSQRKGKFEKANLELRKTHNEIKWRAQKAREEMNV